MIIENKKRPDQAIVPSVNITQIEEDIKVADIKKKADAGGYTEQEAAKAMSMDLKSFKELRATILTAGIDYKRADAGITITEEGLYKLMRMDLDSKKEKALHRLLVEKITSNKNIILARNPMSGSIVRVMVSDSAKWKKGQPMFSQKNGKIVTGCRHIDGDLYSYEFPVPRWNGRTI